MNQVSADDAFGSVEFAENPEPRVPCVLILDTSQSMQGSRINELNAGLRFYKEELLADPLASKRVEVAIVTFGGDVERVVDFVTAHKFQPPDPAAASGNTPMGQAINKALDMIEDRKAEYREHGIAYYRPWAFLITDGEPNDHWKPTILRVRDGERQKAFSFFAVGVEGEHGSARRDLRSHAACDCKASSSASCSAGFRILSRRFPVPRRATRFHFRIPPGPRAGPKFRKLLCGDPSRKACRAQSRCGQQPVPG